MLTWAQDGLLDAVRACSRYRTMMEWTGATMFHGRPEQMQASPRITVEWLSSALVFPRLSPHERLQLAKGLNHRPPHHRPPGVFGRC